jgi:hypothetical protein
MGRCHASAAQSRRARASVIAAGGPCPATTVGAWLFAPPTPSRLDAATHDHTVVRHGITPPHASRSQVSACGQSLGRTGVRELSFDVGGCAGHAAVAAGPYHSDGAPGKVRAIGHGHGDLMPSGRAVRGYNASCSLALTAGCGPRGASPPRHATAIHRSTPRPTCHHFDIHSATVMPPRNHATVRSLPCRFSGTCSQRE